MDRHLPIISPDLIQDAVVRDWYLKRQQGIKHRIPPPTILQLEVTKNCNLRCIMCHKGQMPEGVDFNRSDISDIAVERLKPLYPHLRHAMLFGDGEPMVYSKFWDIVQDIRSASPECAIDFINNGTMMHAKNIERCLDYKVSHMGLSLGGATKASHNYIRKDSDLDQIVKNFQNLKTAKNKLNTFEPYVTALIVVMRSNFREIPDFVKMCHDLQFYDIHLQKLFVTHPSMELEHVKDSELLPFLIEGQKVAQALKIGFSHYPVSGGYFGNNQYSNFNPNDRIFRQHYVPRLDTGYCRFQQPWNTVYVLHDGKVVPDCHWWFSGRETDLNHCGVLSESMDIFDIWYGERYERIRSEISNGNILPQCRGCGLAGGVVDKYRCQDTDHTNPEQESKFVQLNYGKKNRER